MELIHLSTLLLTSFITSQDNKCIFGVIGENVRLPCIYNGVTNLTSILLSSEWRRDMDVIHITDWMKQQEDAQNVSRSTTISSKALNTDFTMVLRDIRLSDAQNYSLHLKLHGVENSSLVCTVCLTVADGVKSNAKDGRLTKYLWIFSTALCVLVFIMVVASLCYQRKLDRDIKRRKHLKFRDDSRSEETEMIMMDTELWVSLSETDVGSFLVDATYNCTDY